ncbi:WXG100 family type VII secretion target [Nocardia sp. NPDC058666]|uniref:WXG100 family type VII secretion target n=1 Tax=Nocardia sp. NPDC058666 TaxID=3346587 RepID=UPI00364DA7C6
MSNVISANFDDVSSGAQSIIDEARTISAMLEDYNKLVKDFVGVAWEGAANDAYAELQAMWHTHTGQLNTTLEGAGALVKSGNSELQSTDQALAGLF